MWDLRAQDRLSAWRDFRQTISELSEIEAIERVNTLWSSAPFVLHHLDYENPQDWPDPWQLLAENTYCNVAKALGMLYTLYYSRWQDLAMEIRVYKEDNEYSDIVWIAEGKYVINYQPWDVVNKTTISQTAVLIHTFTPQSMQLEKYQ